MMEDSFMFNSLDYTFGRCVRCGKEIFIHNEEKMCLVCQYETQYKDLETAKERIKHLLQDRTMLVKEIERLEEKLDAQEK